MKVNSKRELRRIIDRRLECYWCDEYGFSDHEVFIDQVTECYLEEIEDNHGFEWGGEIKDFSIDEDVWTIALDQANQIK